MDVLTQKRSLWILIITVLADFSHPNLVQPISLSPKSPVIDLLGLVLCPRIFSPVSTRDRRLRAFCMLLCVLLLGRFDSFFPPEGCLGHPISLIKVDIDLFISFFLRFHLVSAAVFVYMILNRAS